MDRTIVSPTGPPSPLWVPVNGPKPPDWMERALVHICSAGAQELLTGSRHPDLDDPRSRYIRGALIALRKLGQTATRWLDTLDDAKERKRDELWWRSFADEQSARQRLAWELLIELIGFTGTDLLIYYRHHAALLRLRYLVSRRSDLLGFFDCRPASLDAELEQAAREVVGIERDYELDLAQAWYAARREPISFERLLRVAPARVLSSQRARLKELIPFASASERMALGISYQRLYSRLSHSVHFSMRVEKQMEEPDGARGHGDGDASSSTLRWGAIVFARLGVLCLRRLIVLARVEGGAACKLQREVMENEKVDQHTDLFVSLVDGSVAVGDFALVDDRYLAEVLERASNSLGYFRYRVIYVAERPHPRVEEEWQPATLVHTLWERKKVESWWIEAMATATDSQRKVATSDNEGILLRRFLRLLWEEQYRDEVLEKLDEFGSPFIS